MKKLQVILIIVLFICQNIISQNIQLNEVTQELKENANSIVLSATTTVNVMSIDELVVEEENILLIQNIDGKRHIETYEHYDDDTKIISMSASLFDKNGNRIKKYKVKDFKDQSAISNGQLYTENRVKYLNHNITSFPVILKYKSTVKMKSTIFLENLPFKRLTK